MSGNDQSIYVTYAERWWKDTPPFLKSLGYLVPARLNYIHFHFTTEKISSLKWLDVGCGGGYMSEAMAKMGASVIGVDPLAPLLAVARSHAKAEGLVIDYREGVGEALPLDDRSVDAVICVDVLEHVQDLNQVISEIARVLKPGGLFVFDTINRNIVSTFFGVWVAEYLLGIVPRGTHDPKLFIKPKELKAALSRSGFDLVDWRGLGPVGINRRGDISFGLLPSKIGMYIGHAILREP